MDEATGIGTANDATVEAVNNVTPDEAAAKAEQEAKGFAAAVAAAQDAVAAAQSKVDKQIAHLEGAKASLVEAEAALAALQA